VAAGTPPLTYQWSQNEKAITGAIAASYTTPPTSAADNGAQFTVVVTNGAGSTTSLPATITVNPSPPSLSATLGGGQSTSVSTAFNTDLEVTLTDSSGTPIADEFVTFSAPSSGASAIFANGTTTTAAATNSSGIATSSSLTANSTVGSYLVNASVTGATKTASFTLTNLSPPGIPQFSHVFIVVEENHSFTDVIGNSNMPYLNGLATANSLATRYYADAHPSLPNYFELTVGAGTSITGTSGDSFAGVVTQNNIVRALMAAGKTWKSYSESLPSVGYLGDDSGPYLRRHNPFVYFSDVQNSSAEANNIVPFTQLATDITNHTLPDYAFIVPNVNDDAHNCPVGLTTCTDEQMLAAADQWLYANISPLLASAAFKNSLLIIVFDESVDTDTTLGGGQVAAVLVSPLVHTGYKSTTLYQHESTLRLMMQGLGVTDLPGAAATASDMVEFFH
jgi:acid phosphatase